MAYEVDFIGVEDTAKDADAICIRWWNSAESRYIIGVIDGGFKKHGIELCRIIDKYYFEDKNISERYIDFIICTHADNDHTEGIKEILSNYKVNRIYINLPWKYTSELEQYKDDGRRTVDSINRSLKERYKTICDIEDMAYENDIDIYPIFQGMWIENKLLVLSPSKEWYLELLRESPKTLYKSQDLGVTMINSSKEVLIKFVAYVYSKFEDLFTESLSEEAETSAENEMSTVILGCMDEESFIITGDVGIRGLDKAMKYADEMVPNWRDEVMWYQIPHHGSRHNVTPSILNRMIGNIRESKSNKKAFVCSADNALKKHPLKVVTNAYIRRGVAVFNACGTTVNQKQGLESRDGWSPVDEIEFSSKVEE